VVVAYVDLKKVKERESEKIDEDKKGACVQCEK
jgi:hypothetical protein